MKTIVFDDKSMAWTRDVDRNLMYLHCQAAHLEELFNCRGYMYLNQIYENIGVKWNPGMVNGCYLRTSGPLTFEFEQVSDVAILVKIS